MRHFRALLSALVLLFFALPSHADEGDRVIMRAVIQAIAGNDSTVEAIVAQKFDRASPAFPHAVQFFKDLFSNPKFIERLSELAEANGNRGDGVYEAYAQALMVSGFKRLSNEDLDSFFRLAATSKTFCTTDEDHWSGFASKNAEEARTVFRISRVAIESELDNFPAKRYVTGDESSQAKTAAMAGFLKSLSPELLLALLKRGPDEASPEQRCEMIQAFVKAIDQLPQPMRSWAQLEIIVGGAKPTY